MNVFRQSHRLVSGIVAAAALAATGAAQTLAAPSANSSKFDMQVSRLASARSAHSFSSVIVKSTGPLTASQTTQISALGGDIRRHLPIIQSVALRLPTRSLSRLAALPFVAHVSYDGVVKKCDAFTLNSSEAGVASQQYGLTGAGVGIAVLDTGIHFVNDLAKTPQGGPARIVANNVFGNTNTDDFCGHGTHVAGIIAGNGGASLNNQCFRHFYGIAPQANLVNVKVLNDEGESDVSDVLAGLQWTISVARQYNIRVINLSLGHPVGESYTTDPLCQTLEAAYKAGIVVVCAAGNGGRASVTNTTGASNEGWGTAYGSIQSPGNDPYVITVGATKNMDGIRADDKIATYSGRGPSRLDLIMKPDIIAPGNKVISTSFNNSTLEQEYGMTNEIPYSSYTTQNNGHLSQEYLCLSGTSMATPVVSGAIALLLQANPSLTPDTVKARLMLSADKWYAADGTEDPLTYGAGYLNIPAALASTAVAQGPAASPALSQNSATGSLTLAMTHAIWGSSLWGTGVTDMRALWGSHAIWGSTSVDATHALWGSSITFSASSTLNASHAIWGSSVWGDHALWGSSTTAVDLTSTAINGE